ncbi:hypothetical protein M426DRAFT_318384 [Hypoxylon sp. CI-4A]|nr:hypothetical protein M426DRAFT_318384 [Hypoxylon sp. CI-4A]
MVYYAYIKYEPNDIIYRWMITAPNADTIDEWWRAVSTPHKKDQGYQRLTPDFYTYSKGHPWDGAPEFSSRIFFTLLSDRDARIQSLFPHQERADLRSGQTFFIRSKSKPDVFWWVEPKGSILASTNYRSRFRFDIEGEESGTVMVGKDTVSIHNVTDRQGAFGVTVGNDGLCTTSSHHKHTFPFGDLKRAFLSYHSGYIDQKAGIFAQFPTVLVVEKGNGEEWELVK